MSWRRARGRSSPSGGKGRRLELAHPLDDVGALAAIAQVDKEDGVNDRADAGQQDASYGSHGTADGRFGWAEPELTLKRLIHHERDADEGAQHRQHDTDDRA